MELEAAVQLLESIISKRGKAAEAMNLHTLVKWARKQGQLQEIPLLFSPRAWQGVGECLWQMVIAGGKAGKEAQSYGAIWKLVTETLSEMKTEQQVAMIAAQTVSPEPSMGDEKKKPGRLVTFFGTGHMQPIRGMDAVPSRSVVDLQCCVEEKEEMPAPMPTETEQKAEVATGGLSPLRQKHQGEEGGVCCDSWKNYPRLPSRGSSSSSQSPNESGSQTLAVPHQPEERSTKATMKEVLEKLKDLIVEQQGQDKHQEKPTAPSWTTCTQRCQNVMELRQLDLESQPSSYTRQLNSMQVQKNLFSRWSGVIRDAVLEGEWQAAAAIICPVVTDQVAEWRPHDWKILRQAKQTVTQHGLKSEAAKSILSWIFTADVMAPMDCQNLARLLLTPSEFLMWESEWYRKAQIEANKQQPQGHDLYGITADMITGRGNYASASTQLSYPLALHHLAAQLAQDALFSIPQDKKAPPFPV
ncbi:hypothetical protein DUI87_06762 [Hirundo rustica rustica]|uniref:Uncharacterized protein n=1 Tax=Hirundo rustica rustica TaxID=333673 RepID=A0A3M0KT07_HIRRU|nr:hypothetical protein DUI87_06762 [Hirundo rustica rustica]